MDILCYSHLRWNFVYQRPQHLFSRFTSIFRVFFIEEPLYDSVTAHIEIQNPSRNLYILVPHLPGNMSQESSIKMQQHLLQEVLATYVVIEHIAWYYTPMSLAISNALPQPLLVIYDCMDELSAFKDAPPELTQHEASLIKLADIVFTGGTSLYNEKKKLHQNIHCCPSSIDKEHFGKARLPADEPADQKHIPHPRLGFFGVIDERLDIPLLDEIALRRPEWNFIMIGPVVKVDPAQLPRHQNIHYLGSKTYDELPAYLGGWDAALLLFARNPSTRFISPTKTPEYLAGGKPVVSTSIYDVVHPYGMAGLVHIADSPVDFIGRIEDVLSQQINRQWLQSVDCFLAGISWDKTWEKMLHQINLSLEKKKQVLMPFKILNNV